MQRLRILNYSWHAGHQYELHKLPHDFTLVIGEAFPRWKFKLRPMQAGVCCLPLDAALKKPHDLAILHFDERLLDHDPADGREEPLLYFKRTLDIPMLAICHGTPPLQGDRVDEAKKTAVVRAVGDTPVILNSHNAREAWGFQNAVTLWHGFDLRDYPETRGQRQTLTIANFDPGRRRYQGHDLFARVNQEEPCDLLWARGKGTYQTVKFGKRVYFIRNLIYNLFRRRAQKSPLELSAFFRHWVLNPYARGRFLAYRNLIRNYRVFFNPTRWSPMPRSRGEAMLCGLAMVTSNYQDEDRFIDNEKDGFYSNEAEQLIDYLRFLRKNPLAAREIGQAGRRTAARVFSIDRFLGDWQKLLREWVPGKA